MVKIVKVEDLLKRKGIDTIVAYDNRLYIGNSDDSSAKVYTGRRVEDGDEYYFELDSLEGASVSYPEVFANLEEIPVIYEK